MSLKNFVFLIVSETNHGFENSKRNEIFKNMIGDFETDASKMYFQKNLVYSILDSSIAKNIISFFQSSDLQGLSDTEKFKLVYTNENFKRLEQLFAYIGSGIYTRPHQHVIRSKAMCPSKNKNFVHMYSSAALFYICATVFDFPPQKSTPKNNDIFIYPIMGVKNLENSLMLETALIYTLHGIIINTKHSVTFDPKKIHFLAHYAIESTLRYLKNQQEGIKYDHRITPEFPIHEVSTFGMYENSDSPNKLIFQSNVYYEYESQNIKLPEYKLNVADVEPYVRLPLGILDFELPDETAQKSLRKEFDKQMVSNYNLVMFFKTDFIFRNFILNLMSQMFIIATINVSLVLFLVF